MSQPQPSPIRPPSESRIFRHTVTSAESVAGVVAVNYFFRRAKRIKIQQMAVQNESTASKWATLGFYGPQDKARQRCLKAEQLGASVEDHLTLEYTPEIDAIILTGVCIAPGLADVIRFSFTYDEMEP